MKKITNTERILYLLIIVIQFAIIIFYFIQLTSIKNKIEQSGLKFIKIQQIENINSFSGINRLNKEEFINFSPSSKKTIILIKISSDCSYCSAFIEKFNKYLIGHEIDKDIEIIYISNTEYAKMFLIDGFKFLKIKNKQTLQNFGFRVPVMYVVNGKGDVLFQSNKPENKTFDRVFNIIKKQ